MKRWHAILALLLVVVLWGTTFVLIRDGATAWNPIVLVALRFLVASACVLPWAGTEVRRWKRADWAASILLGSLLFVGFVTQALGLNLTSAAGAAFSPG